MSDAQRLPARQVGLPAVVGPPKPDEWNALKQQASVIAKSGLAPKSVNTPEKILVIAMKARELSLPPLQGLAHIHIVEGKPTLSAELMAALAQRAGHRLRIIETSNERCEVEGLRADDPDHPSRVVFDMEDAKRAGVATKGPWKQYPAAMLRARAISALCRFAFADVLMGASYTPEELGAEVNEEGEVVEAEPAPLGKDDLRVSGRQLKLLRALIADVVEDGVAKFEEMMGKPVSELTRAEASEWIMRLDSGEEPVDKGEEERTAVHRDVLTAIGSAWNRIHPDQRPGQEQVRDSTKESFEHANKVLSRLERLAKEYPADTEPEGGGWEGATEDQVARLTELADEVHENRDITLEGGEWLQREKGLPFSEMSRAEAMKLIAELEAAEKGAR